MHTKTGIQCMYQLWGVGNVRDNIRALKGKSGSGYNVVVINSGDHWVLAKVQEIGSTIQTLGSI